MTQKVYDKGLVTYKFFEEVINAVRYDLCQTYYLIFFCGMIALQSSLYCVTVCLCAYRFYATLYLHFSISMSLYLLVSLSVCLSACLSADLSVFLPLYSLYLFIFELVFLSLFLSVFFFACIYFVAHFIYSLFLRNSVFLAFRVSSLVSYCLESLIHRRALYFNPVVIFMVKVKTF